MDGWECGWIMDGYNLMMGICSKAFFDCIIFIHFHSFNRLGNGMGQNSSQLG
jgi:hypothetical protein